MAKRKAARKDTSTTRAKPKTRKQSHFEELDRQVKKLEAERASRTQAVRARVPKKAVAKKPKKASADSSSSKTRKRTITVSGVFKEAAKKAKAKKAKKKNGK